MIPRAFWKYGREGPGGSDLPRQLLIDPCLDAREVKRPRGHTSAAIDSAHRYVRRMPSQALITTAEVAALDPATLATPHECRHMLARLDSLIIELDSRMGYADVDDAARAAGESTERTRREPKPPEWRVRIETARRRTALMRDQVALREAELVQPVRVKLAATAGELRIIAEAMRQDRAAGRLPSAIDQLRLDAIADSLVELAP